MLAIVKVNSLTRGYIMKALDVASYFIELANKTPENDLTNLKLQKLLYYVQGKYIAQNDAPIFEDKVEAWKYGPVVADVYHTFKVCGQFPVTTFDVNYDSAELDADSKSFVEKIWEDIGEKYSGFFLVQTTHKNGTPWAKHFNEDGRNIEIPQSDLKEYFTANEL